MTRIENGVLIIEEEPPGTCEVCGVEAELRPYGPNGARICYDCGPGSDDPARVEAAKVAFKHILDQAGF